MTHRIAAADRQFAAAFASGDIAPERFDHRSHVRLAYVYLAEHDDDTALAMMRAALLEFLGHHGIPSPKYHETMTRAWILAVRHFMKKTPHSASADAFIDTNPMMLDGRIMLTHYSAALLFSAQARERFVEPDLDPIPRYEAR